MKNILLITALLVLSICLFAKKNDKVEKYNEIYRNQFHFSPEINKMGSPIALWVSDSTYHMFYQYNPHNLLDGYVNWGHAISNDLISWKESEISIHQPETVTDSMIQSPWWGSVSEQKDGIYAWINRWDDGLYKTKSTNGKDWDLEQKTIGTEGFSKSESHVFWHKQSKKWVMVNFDRATTTMFILNSDDGLNWEQTSKFNYNFGYPQLIELPVDRKLDYTRWVLATEKGTYILGEFDGKKIDIKSTIKYFRIGNNIGGTVLYNDPLKNRTVVLTALKSKQLADIGSNGNLTFPAELTLHETSSGIELIQKPIDKIKLLHSKFYSWENEKIYPGINDNLLKKVKGKELHIKGVIDILNCDQFGFLIRNDRENKGSEISFDVRRGIFSMLISQIEYQPVNNKVEFEILIDRSTIELYLDKGKYVFSRAFDPSPEGLKYELFTKGGEIMVEWMEVYQLTSIWSEK